MTRTYTRGSTLYQVSGRWPRYDVSVSCECDAGHHWHHLARVRTTQAAERLISVHAVSAEGIRALHPSSQTPPVSESPRRLRLVPRRSE